MIKLSNFKNIMVNFSSSNLEQNQSVFELEVECEVDSNLEQCLVSCAMLRESDLINADEYNKIKLYLLSLQDSMKLDHFAKEFESTGCLRKFRDSIAGFMGDP